MQRRHFIALAAAMKASKPPRLGQIADEQHVARAQWETCVSEVASVCATLDTSRGFDRQRFLRACGVSE